LTAIGDPRPKNVSLSSKTDKEDLFTAVEVCPVDYKAGAPKESHPAEEPDHVKNSKSRFQTERKIPSENEGKASDFARYGMPVNRKGAIQPP